MNQKTERVIYNYSLPRRKRELINYVQAILGVPALTLFVLSFYLGLSKPWYFLLSAMGLFFAKKFIYVVWRYFKDENLETVQCPSPPPKAPNNAATIIDQ